MILSVEVQMYANVIKGSSTDRFIPSLVYLPNLTCSFLIRLIQF